MNHAGDFGGNKAKQSQLQTTEDRRQKTEDRSLPAKLRRAQSSRGRTDDRVR